MSFFFFNFYFLSFFNLLKMPFCFFCSRGCWMLLIVFLFFFAQLIFSQRPWCMVWSAKWFRRKTWRQRYCPRVTLWLFVLTLSICLPPFSLSLSLSLLLVHTCTLFKTSLLHFSLLSLSNVDQESDGPTSWTQSWCSQLWQAYCLLTAEQDCWRCIHVSCNTTNSLVRSWLLFDDQICVCAPGLWCICLSLILGKVGAQVTVMTTWCGLCLLGCTAWCSEIGSLTLLDAPELHASSDVREPISLHQVVHPVSCHLERARVWFAVAVVRSQRRALCGSCVGEVRQHVHASQRQCCKSKGIDI